MTLLDDDLCFIEGSHPLVPNGKRRVKCNGMPLGLRLDMILMPPSLLLRTMSCEKVSFRIAISFKQTWSLYRRACWPDGRSFELMMMFPALRCSSLISQICRKSWMYGFTSIRDVWIAETASEMVFFCETVSDSGKNKFWCREVRKRDASLTYICAKDSLPASDPSIGPIRWWTLPSKMTLGLKPL